MIGVSMAATFSWLACSSSSNAPANGGVHDGSTAGDGSPDAAAEVRPRYDPNGPYAACNDPESQTSTLLADGFDAWDGFGGLGCFDPAQPVDDAKCDDIDVTGGAFTVIASVCTGNRWDVHIFDGARGLDCNTTSPPIDKVFTLTPADCTCASPNRDPSTGCAARTDGGVDGDAGQGTVEDGPADSG
jgi:hypothetical protein